jgi:hypothetical protein
MSAVYLSLPEEEAPDNSHRFFTRGILLRAFGADDYMMMVTLVGLFASLLFLFLHVPRWRAEA